MDEFPKNARHDHRTELVRGFRGINALELLVVMAAIGIFAGLIFPTISRARTKAKVAATKMIMVQLGIALEMYHNEFREYPDTFQDLILINIDPSELPTDPFNPGQAFQYFTNLYPYRGSFHAPGQLWGLASFGPDGDGDVQINGGIGSGSVIPSQGTLYDGSSAYDALISELEALSVVPQTNNPFNAEQQPGFSSGDILVFGPVPLESLRQRDENQGVPPADWQPLPW